VTERSDLGDRIALAIVGHGPLSCERLARVVTARTVDVRSALRSDPRFARTGAGPGTRWTVALRSRDGRGRVDPGVSDSDDAVAVRTRLDAIERRLAKLERLLGAGVGADVAAPINRQLTVDDVLELARNDEP
jgi:hypothetical protein